MKVTLWNDDGKSLRSPKAHGSKFMGPQDHQPLTPWFRSQPKNASHSFPKQSYDEEIRRRKLEQRRKWFGPLSIACSNYEGMVLQLTKMVLNPNSLMWVTPIIICVPFSCFQSPNGWILELVCPFSHVIKRIVQREQIKLGKHPIWSYENKTLQKDFKCLTTNQVVSN